MTYDIEKIISEMTLSEKAALVNGATFFGTSAVDRLGIPALMLLDGGTGINFEQLFGDFLSKEEIAAESTNGMVGKGSLARVIEDYYHPEKLNDEEKELRGWIEERLDAITGKAYSPACFPSGILLGATFDPEVVHSMGNALGREARLFGIHILLGTPNINIHRDPLGGRIFEGYSEDPYLISRLAPELVKGVQEMGVAANVKHFAANNQETNRVGINETISARALQEIYLPGFRACVTEGKAKTVMSAYNRINGVPCSENKWLLTDTLRDEWGFEGMVVSDWGAVYNPVSALRAGNDLAMPGPISGAPIEEAVRKGDLTMETLDTAVRRILKLISFCTDNTNGYKVNDLDIVYEESTKAAYNAAAAGIVLLKNENSLYPLENGGNILITGSGSRELAACGTGSAGITTDRTSDLAETISEALTDSHIKVYDFIHEKAIEEKTDVIFVASVNGMEGNDRADMLLSSSDRENLARLCRLRESLGFTLTLVLNVCGPVDISEYESEIDAVFVCFLPGMEGAHALGDIMTGKTYPSGKLPLSFPKRYEDAPTFLNFPGEGNEVNYGEGIYVGYRYYDKKKIKPAYPFGFGFSYTTFSLEGLTLDCDEFENEITGHVTVRNTGSREGAEVVQIYISDPVSTLPKPVKELKFFEKVRLDAGESRVIDFTLSQSDFASFDTDYGMWLSEEGDYDIIAATSSDPGDEHQRVRVYLKTRNQYTYGVNTSVKVLYEKEELQKLLCKLWSDNSWDWQIVESNYQYTSSRKLFEIFPSEPTKDSLESFASAAEKVRH